jgi:hypothetical protein
MSVRLTLLWPGRLFRTRKWPRTIGTTQQRHQLVDTLQRHAQTLRSPEQMEPEYVGPFLVPLLVGALACAFFTRSLAESKGHNSDVWVMAGLFFGPLALLAAVGLPDLKTRKYLRLLAEHQGAIEPELPPPSASSRGVFDVS